MPIGSVASPPASPQAATQEDSGLDFRVELELDTKGYCIIPNVLSASDVAKARDLFFRWHATIPADDTTVQRRRRFNGIYASHGVGHAPLAWFVRTHPNVLAAFRRALRAAWLPSGFCGGELPNGDGGERSMYCCCGCCW